MRKVTLRVPSRRVRAVVYVVAVVGFVVWIASGPERPETIADMPWSVLILAVAAGVVAGLVGRFLTRKRG